LRDQSMHLVCPSRCAPKNSFPISKGLHAASLTEAGRFLADRGTETTVCAALNPLLAIAPNTRCVCTPFT
jgi:hypothetical protein